MTLLAAIRSILGYTGDAAAPPSNNIEAMAAYDPNGLRAVPLAIAARGLIGSDGTPGGALTSPTFTNSAETEQVLTYAATVNWDMDLGGIGILTLAGNGAIANPTNARNGATYMLHLIQDGTGTRIPTWGTDFEWANDTIPTLSTTAGKIDIFTFIRRGGKMYGTAVTGF